MQSFVVPKRTLNSSGEQRQVGFELEFAGIPLEEVANIVASQVDGKINKVSEAEFLIECERYSDFRVELDWAFAKATAQERLDDKALDTGADTDNVDDPVMKWVTRLAGAVVPIEIVCPPIPIEELNVLDPMVKALRSAGALGTGHTILYAFGLHANPELPNLAPSTISGYLQSFIAAKEWLVQRHNVDFSRRVTPYIDHFPEEYEAVVMEYDDKLSQDDLIADYLTHNPTRNRALDLLPLLKHIDAEKVMAAVPDPRINARPTFHYRLPNCEIEQDDWSLATSWNLWCVLETLSEDDALREEMIEHWHLERAQSRFNLERPWHQKLDAIYQDLLSA